MLTRLHHRAACGALILVALSATAAATTWTVDDGGGADFTDLPAAIAAAAPGDTLLVAPGSYSSFTLGYGRPAHGSRACRPAGARSSRA